MERKRALPESIAKDVEEATSSLLPKKSRDAYYKELNYFNNWKQENNVSGVSEDVVLGYFFNVSKRVAASSMWTKYSMLRATLKLHENADISQYSRLIAFLKNESKNHKPKKAKVHKATLKSQFPAK
ncbi:hypothetical protein Zmor_013861 [Zophobas morio]|uniref:Uncharacterized protein n=1 Tax=Zophobas morio TaxID=2755281 RepID=A0AA38IB66_9CUCU|nr:hypothetical protein Zmor_013861 [Zophobas morio]